MSFSKVGNIFLNVLECVMSINYQDPLRNEFSLARDEERRTSELSLADVWVREVRWYMC